MAVGHLDRLKRLGERADLVDLDEDCVARAHLDSLLQELHVRHEEVVADKLAASADSGRQFLPAFPVVLVKPVLDRINRVFRDKLLKVGDLLVVGEALAVRVLLGSVGELLVIVEELAVLFHAEFARRAVHRDFHVVARLVACILDCLDNRVERIVDSVELGGKSALVTDSGGKPPALEQLRERMENLGPHADGLFLGFRADRTDHEFLERDGSVRVRASVDDVHHRDGKDMGVRPADVAVERDVQGLRGGLRGRK